MLDPYKYIKCMLGLCCVAMYLHNVTVIVFISFQILCSINSTWICDIVVHMK